MISIPQVLFIWKCLKLISLYFPTFCESVLSFGPLSMSCFSLGHKLKIKVRTILFQNIKLARFLTSNTNWQTLKCITFFDSHMTWCFGSWNITCENYFLQLSKIDAPIFLEFKIFTQPYPRLHPQFLGQTLNKCNELNATPLPMPICSWLLVFLTLIAH
jgi:hypothetical protein